MTDLTRLPLPQPLPRPDGWTIPGVYTADQMHAHAAAQSAADNAALRAEIYAQQKVIAAYEQCNPPWVQELREQVRVLWEALSHAEAALSDIGDAEHEPGDDFDWCGRRAAKPLPMVRAALEATK